jgi:hypothetical protein
VVNHCNYATVGGQCIVDTDCLKGHCVDFVCTN